MGAKLTDLQRAERHEYVTAHGRKPAPSVSAILDVLAKPALAWAAAEIAAKTAYDIMAERRMRAVVMEHRQERLMRGAKIRNLEGEKVGVMQANDLEIFIDYCRGEHQRVWSAKADVGSRAHDHAYSWLKGETAWVSPDEMGFMDGLKDFIYTYRPVDLAAERIVVHPDPEGDESLEYGGRLDRISALDGPDYKGTYLIDIKTSRPGYDFEKALQLILYMRAKGFAVYGADGALADYEPLPKLDGGLLLYLSADGTFKLVDPFKGMPQDMAWETAMGARRILRAQKLFNQKEVSA